MMGNLKLVDGFINLSQLLFPKSKAHQKPKIKRRENKRDAGGPSDAAQIYTRTLEGKQKTSFSLHLYKLQK